jgi:hypothetical protein
LKMKLPLAAGTDHRWRRQPDVPLTTHRMSSLVVCKSRRDRS